MEVAMKIKTLLFTIGLNMGVINLLISQTAPFNLDAYKDFLQENKDMTTTGLLEMYPAGYFLDDVDLSYEHALYFDTIDLEYALSGDEKDLLRKNGFVVTERLRQPSFNEHFKAIYKRDLPVFISTDAILHAYHCSYDAILRDVEIGYLVDEIKSLLTKMHASMDQLVQKYGDQEPMESMLKDVDVYITVPLKLLEMEVTPFYTSNQGVIDTILELIHREQYVKYKIFSDQCRRDIDFSQFRPRGHYVYEEQYNNLELEHYFRAMMWLGRIEIYLDLPESDLGSFQCTAEQTKAMVARQAVDALLLVELLDMSGAKEEYEEIEEIISFFVGEQDNTTYPQLKSVLDELDIIEAPALLDTNLLRLFQETLSTKTFSRQQIVSHILHSDPLSPEGAKAAPAFLLFGQRFVIDSYITGNVVFDHILYQGTRPCRLFPSTLDILFAFGNDASTELLIPELQQYNYSSNLAGLRYLVDLYDDSFWESSLYHLWLKAIKALSPPGYSERYDLPAFMQTGAWGLEKMNTQLASWTELRHDNLLYAKQSYTTWGSCTYPYGYVEPVPDFYRVLSKAAQIALEKFEDLNIDAFKGESLVAYLNHLQYVTEMLAGIAEKELKNICLEEDEITFIKELYTRGESGRCGHVPPSGWYPELFYYAEEIEKNDFLVADYHTTPSDCGGYPIGAVSHAGTGYIDLLITEADTPDGQRIAFIGPVMSYHEYRTTNFKRLTDQEWKESYFQKSFRPEWVRGYLADVTGQSGSSVLKLAASKQEIEKMLGTGYHIVQSKIPDTYDKCPISLVNSPNPFTGSTVISYTIPELVRNSVVRLNVYDLQGKVIQTLVNEVLPPGNYITKWDGTNSSGESVATGMYIIRIAVGKLDETFKVMVVR